MWWPREPDRDCLCQLAQLPDTHTAPAGLSCTFCPFADAQLLTHQQTHSAWCRCRRQASRQPRRAPQRSGSICRTQAPRQCQPHLMPRRRRLPRRGTERHSSQPQMPCKVRNLGVIKRSGLQRGLVQRLPGADCETFRSAQWPCKVWPVDLLAGIRVINSWRLTASLMGSTAGVCHTVRHMLSAGTAF